MNNKKYNNKGGYTLVEILLYIVLFAILSVAVVTSLVALTRSFKETTIKTDMVQSASIMERISREIRQAYGISSISGSDLKLNTNEVAGNNKTVRFLLTGSDLQLFENDVLIGNLNTPNVAVRSLSFTEITTTIGKAVKVGMSTLSTRDPSVRLVDFYNTIVLRGNY